MGGWALLHSFRTCTCPAAPGTLQEGCLSAGPCAQVDPERNLLYVRGGVPGHKGNFVCVRDAALVPFKKQPQRPLPTWLGPLPDAPMVALPSATDPFATRE